MTPDLVMKIMMTGLSTAAFSSLFLAASDKKIQHIALTVSFIGITVAFFAFVAGVWIS